MSQIITFRTGGIVPPGIAVVTLTGDSGGPVPPNGAGNIEVITGTATNNAGSTVTIVGTPLNNTLTFNVTDGAFGRNTIIGRDAGSAATSSTQFNTGLGYGVLASLSLVPSFAEQNTAVGFLAGNAITIGRHNTLMGSGAGTSIVNGVANVAVGQSSLAALISGSSNIALNGGSSYTSSESSNIVFNSPGVILDNNTLRIGNATGAGSQELNRAFIHGINGVTSSNPLMVTINSATSQLGVAAVPSSSISITGDSGGALTGAAFTFTGGTTGLTFAGAVSTETLGGTLAIANGGTNATSMSTSTGIVKYNGTSLVTSTTATIDSSNRMTNTAQPAFLASATSTQNSVTGDGTSYTVIFNTSAYDQASNYNTGTGVFTAPVTGKYLFNWSVGIANIGALHNVLGVELVTTALGYASTVQVVTAQAYSQNSYSGSVVANMSATDTASILLFVAGSTKTINIVSGGFLGGDTVTYFSGTLIC